MLRVNPNPAMEWQQQIINITTGEKSRRIIFQLRYLEQNDLWYISLYEGQTGESICTFVPVIVSKDEAVNLFAPFKHKNIGAMFCISNVDNPSTENPSKDNWEEFALYWSGVDE